MLTSDIVIYFLVAILLVHCHYVEHNVSVLVRVLVIQLCVRHTPAIGRATVIQPVY